MRLSLHHKKRQENEVSAESLQAQKLSFVKTTLKQCAYKKRDKKGPYENMSEFLSCLKSSDSDESQHNGEQSSASKKYLHRNIYPVIKKTIYQEIVLDQDKIIKHLKADYPTKHSGSQTLKLKISSLVDKKNQRTYYISQSIASGGIGKVRLALDDKNHFFAFKEFRLNPSEFSGKKNTKKNDDYFRTEFTTIDGIRNELKVGRKINSPVMMRKLFNDQGKIYALMNYMDGGSINRLGMHLTWESLNHVQNIPEYRTSLCWSLLAQVGQELVSLHEHEIVHCDVKPGNILFDKQGHFALTDFDGSVRLDASGYAKKGSYTRGYRAPERSDSWHHAFSTSADIWSLGVTILDFWSSTSKHKSDMLEPVWPNPFFGETDELCSDHLHVYEIFRKIKTQPGDASSRLLSSLDNKQVKNYNDFVLSFHYLKKYSPELEKFLLNEMLNPNPHARPSASSIVKMAHAHLNSKMQKKASEYMEKVALYQRERLRLVAYALSLASQQIPLKI